MDGGAAARGHSVSPPRASMRCRVRVAAFQFGRRIPTALFEGGLGDHPKQAADVAGRQNRDVGRLAACPDRAGACADVASPQGEGSQVVRGGSHAGDERGPASVWVHSGFVAVLVLKPAERVGCGPSRHGARYWQECPPGGAGEALMCVNRPVSVARAPVCGAAVSADSAADSGAPHGTRGNEAGGEPFWSSCLPG